MADETKARVGSTLESLLREDGMYDEVKNDAIKAVLAYKLTEAMKAQNLSKARMAERMGTSRSQLDRLLDPVNEGVTLHTVKRAADAVGMHLGIAGPMDTESRAERRQVVNYWITTHWPPRGDEESRTEKTEVWVPEGRQQAANDMRPGDYVAVYESRSGRAEIRMLPDGTTTKVACKAGRERMICYGTVDSRVSAIPDSQPTKYTNGSEIWWRWRTPVTVWSRTGFVARPDLLRILGYKKPNWNLRGFGDYHSGLKKIREAEFKALVQAFHASRPIELPINTRAGGHGHNGGGEGAIHRNLKNYVASNPAVALKEAGLQLVKVEYEFPTNDRADIVLVDQHNRIVGVEIEPSVPDINLVGLLQAIKYRNMLECVADREAGESRGMLIAHEIGAQVKALCTRYGIEAREIRREEVDSWVAHST